MEKQRFKSNKSLWFRCLLGILRPFFQKRDFIYEGEMPGKNSIVISNHSAASSPVFFAMFAKFNSRFWGIHEMTGGVKESYNYLAKNYLPLKRHYPKWLSYIIAGIIVHFVWFFYKGLRLIPSYNDQRFPITISKTIEVLKSGETVIIFPEDSHNGYHKELTHFFPGGFYAADKYFEVEKDITLFPCYYVKPIRSFVFGKGIKYSELSKKYGKDYQKMADEFCILCNNLGKRYNEISNKKKKIQIGF